MIIMNINIKYINKIIIYIFFFLIKKSKHIIKNKII